jgi:hypothetical protein
MDLKKKPWLQPEWIVAILITIAVFALHFYYWLHIGGFWRDEVNLIVLAHKHSFAEMAKDSFPVLMPLIVRLWFAIGLGDSDLHLRLIGFMVGLGTLAALWVGLWKIRREAPLIGLVLLGLNSTMIFFGDSLRAYGLGSVMAIMLTASAFVFLQKPSVAHTAWLALFGILSVQVLYHNAVLVAAVCCGAWSVCWRRSDGGAAIQILIVAIVSAASLLPYSHVLAGFSSGDATSLLVRTGATMRRFIWSCEDTFGFPLYGYIYVWAALGLMIIVCACIGVWAARERPTGRADRQVSQDARQGLSAAGSGAVSATGGEGGGSATCEAVTRRLDACVTGADAALTPKLRTASSTDDFSLFAGVVLIVAAIGFPVFFWRAQMPMQSWYLLPFMGAAVVCFDGARPVFAGVLRMVFVALVAGTALLSGLSTASVLTRHFSNVNIFARELAQDAAPQDYILVYPWNWAITFDYYYKGKTPWNTVPSLADHSVHRVDLILAQMENTNALAPDLEKISGTLKSGHRVWYLGMAGMRIPMRGTPPPPPLPPPPLKYYGWSEFYYSAVWERQTVQFIADHSVSFRQFKFSALDGYLTENMGLYVAEGWTNGVKN